MIRLGQMLHDERVRKRLSLEQIAKDIKIKPQFLDAIEKEDYNKLPSPAYAQGFVRNYADYLGLPKAQTSALFKRDFDEKKVVQVLPDGMSRQKDFPIKRTNTRKLLVSTIIILLILGFLIFQYRSVVASPSLEIVSPKDGSTVSQNVEIVGRTDASATITVNNEPVFVNNNGEFIKNITLFPGKTSFIVRAKNRLGKETVIKENLTVNQ